MTGKDVINDISEFIKSNKLQDVKLQDFEDLTFSVYLDDNHEHEIEYTFVPVTLEETIKHLVFDRSDPDVDDMVSSEEISREDAMKLREETNE